MAQDDFKVQNFEGRRTFDFIFEQVEHCIKDIYPLFSDLVVENIYKKEHYYEVSKLISVRPKIDLKQLALCDISYNIVFFGLGSNNINILKRLFDNIIIQHLLKLSYSF